MPRKKKDESVLKKLNGAVEEARAVRKDIQYGAKGEHPGLTSDILARYQLIMDEAEKEIAEEYRAGGSLTSAKICEINRGMDDYALTVRDVEALLNKLEERRQNK